MIIEDLRDGFYLTRQEPNDNNIIKLEGFGSAGVVVVNLEEGFRVSLDYTEIEAIAREMMKNYTGKLKEVK